MDNYPSSTFPIDDDPRFDEIPLLSDDVSLVEKQVFVNELNAGKYSDSQIESYNDRNRKRQQARRNDQAHQSFRH